MKSVHINRPPIKWLGNKTNLITQIAAQFRNSSRLVEPFCGSCSVALNTKFDYYHLADSNNHLINFYQYMREDDALELMEEFFELNNPADYYIMRNEFNKMHPTEGATHAAYFYYLNRHCFRGVMRYNSSGGFNTPYGNYKHPKILKNEIVHMSNKLDGFYHVADFQETMKEVKNGDTVYIDPPYLPISKTSNFTEYTPDGMRFHDDEHELIDGLAFSIVADQPDTEIVISNHDNLCVRGIYKNATEIVSIGTQSRIDNTKERKELLIIYRGKENAGIE